MLQLADGTVVQLPAPLVEVFPFVTRLLDEGVIPSERLPRSRHRRVMLSDLLAFPERREGSRRLAELAEEADLPY